MTTKKNNKNSQRIQRGKKFFFTGASCFPEYLPKLFPVQIILKKSRDSIRRIDILAKV